MEKNNIGMIALLLGAGAIAYFLYKNKSISLSQPSGDTATAPISTYSAPAQPVFTPTIITPVVTTPTIVNNPQPNVTTVYAPSEIYNPVTTYSPSYVGLPTTIPTATPTATAPTGSTLNGQPINPAYISTSTDDTGKQWETVSLPRYAGMGQSQPIQPLAEIPSPKKDEDIFTQGLRFAGRYL